MVKLIKSLLDRGELVEKVAEKVVAVLEGEHGKGGVAINTPEAVGSRLIS